MKYLSILVVFVLLGSNCIGQFPIQDNLMRQDTIKPKTDTVRCLMLVCDTSEKYSIWPSFEIDTAKTRIYADTSKSLHKDYAAIGKWTNDTTNRHYLNDVWWQFGYEVREYGYMTLWPPKEYTYLDQNKKPLSKSIVVWMTKEIKL